MNKSDRKLVIGILIFVFIGLFLFFILPENDQKVAKVYYQNKIVLTIDLTRNQEQKYTITGTNGDVTIEVKQNKIRVVEENSPRHLCSKQGYISSSKENIVCLPNEIVIRIEDTEKYDTIVK